MMIEQKSTFKPSISLTRIQRKGSCQLVVKISYLIVLSEKIHLFGEQLNIAEPKGRGTNNWEKLKQHFYS